MSAWVGVLLVSILSCMGQMCQKQAAGAAHPAYAARWLCVALLLLALALLLWLVVLQQLPVGIAYPMLSLNLVWITLAARRIWQEPMGWRHILGILFIISGVFLLGVTA